MSKAETTFAEDFAGMTVAIVAIAVSCVMKAFVITKLWAWFVLPFSSIPVPSMAMALGLSLFANYMTGISSTPSDKDKTLLEKSCSSLANSIFIPLIVLLIGFIVSCFV